MKYHSSCLYYMYWLLDATVCIWPFGYQQIACIYWRSVYLYRKITVKKRKKEKKKEIHVNTNRTRTVLLDIHLPLSPCIHRLYLSQWGFLCYHLYPFNYIQRIFTALHPIHPLGPVFYFDFIYTPSADNSFFLFCFFFHASTFSLTVYHSFSLLNQY